MYWHACVVFAALFLSVQCRDQDFDEGPMRLKAIGRSGKVELCQKQNNATKRRGKCLRLEFDDLTELDDADGAVSCRGSGHFYRNFAKTDFSVSESLVTTDFQGIPAVYFFMSAGLNSNAPNATLKADFYMFKQDGNYTVGENETVYVLQGDLKMNIEVEGWRFCGNGSEEDNNYPANRAKLGKYLRLRLAFTDSSGKAPKKKERKQQGGAGKDGDDDSQSGAGKQGSGKKEDGPSDNKPAGDQETQVDSGDEKDGKKGKKERRENKGGQEFEVGDGNSLTFSEEYQVDAGDGSQMKTQKMKPGWPKLGAAGGKNYVEVVFEKGARFVYDPNVAVKDAYPEASYPKDPDDTDAGGDISGVSSVTASLAVLLVGAFIAL